MSRVSDLVVIDPPACERVASILAQARIPEDKEDIRLLIPPAGVGNFYFSLVAICHQTQTLHGRVANVPTRGWDYLQARWLEAAERDAHLLTPEGWASMRVDALTRVFADPDGGNTMTAVERRVALLNDLGSGMLQGGWVSLCELYQLSAQRVGTGSPNLISLLQGFRAYNDPVRKKAFFLLGLMRNSAGWVYADEEELGAPVDYHEVRGHLRLGTVVVNDARLREKLLRQIPVDEVEDVTLRSRVAEAIRFIAELAGVRDCIRLHYLFWNLFRSVCKREYPHCRTPPPDSALPARYSHLIGTEAGSRHCPFCAICPSADLSRRYVQHSFETDWY